MKQGKFEERGISLFNTALVRLRKNKLAMFGLLMLAFIGFVSIFAPFITGYGYDTQNLLETYQPPSYKHWLGTDDLGRDVFARLVYGGRVSLLVGLVATGIATAFGVILGACAGFFGGKADNIIMRITDIFMCFPFYVIAITMAAIWGSGMINIMLISGFLNWTSICRIVRAEVLSIKQREFIEASRSLGLSSDEIIRKHILPNTLSVIIVYATLGIAKGILSEAGLSYLGLGVTPPQPSWGNMLAAAQSLRVLRLYWWLWIPAGAAVFVTILSINLFGDGLRDAFDAKVD